MTFQHPQLLWLAALPALLFAWEIARAIRAARNARLRGGAHGKILSATATAGAVHITRAAAAPRRLTRWLLASALACAAVALARPQWGRTDEPVFEQSREILIALDLSRSMLADDVKPSRLERSRLLVQNLLSELDGERVGLVVFAGTAFLQIPLSSDYEILREMLQTLNPGYLPQAGTNYAALLETALEAYGKSDADRFLVVLSDGEADPANPWRTPAEECKQRGIRALTLGVGTAAGAMISDEATGGLVKDDRGAVVLSRLEPATLQELATLTGGVYTDASQWVDIAALVRDTVAKGRRGDFREAARPHLVERFQWALAPALLLLLLALWREFPVRPRPRRVALPASLVAAATLLFLGVVPRIGAVADVPAPAAPDATATLSALVGKLATQDTLSAQDTTALAEATLAYGEPLRAEGKPVLEGPVNDALEAVRRAEKAAPDGTDWATLRKRLEALKQQPQEQQQDKKDDKKQDKKDDKDDQKQDKENKDNPQNKDNQQNKDGQQDQQDKSDGTDKDGQKQQQQKQDGKDQDGKQQDGKQQDGKDQQGKQSDGTDKGQEKQSDKATKREDGKAFENMRDKAEKQKQAQAAQQATPPPQDTNTQRVGGTAAQGTPLDKNSDPKLLAPLQQLERVKEGDSPAVLFQRINNDDKPQQQQPANGRTW